MRRLRPGDRVKLFFPPKADAVIDPPRSLDGKVLTGPNGKPWQFSGEYMYVVVIKRTGNQLVGVLDTRNSIGGHKFSEVVTFSEEDPIEKHYNGKISNWLLFKVLGWMK